MLITYQYLLRAYEQFHDVFNELNEKEKSSSKVNQKVQSAAQVLLQTLENCKETEEIVVAGDPADLTTLSTLVRADLEKNVKIIQGGGYDRTFSMSATETAVTQALNATNRFIKTLQNR